MAQYAPNWYVQQWRDGVTHVYQAKGFRLKNTTSRPVQITGDKMFFLVAQTGDAEEDVRRGDKAVPINPQDDKVAVETKKSRAMQHVYEDDLDQMTVEYRAVVNARGAMALGRVHDATILKAAKDGSTLTPIQNANYDLPLTPIALMQAKQNLMAQEVDVADGNIFAAVNSVSWAVLMTYEIFSSADYVGPDLPFVKSGMARTWNGMHIFAPSDQVMKKAGLIGIGGVATAAEDMVWHRDALGFGWVRQVTGTVQWDNDYDRWTHNLRMRIGAKAILGNGIQRIKVDYDAAHIALPA